MISCSIAQKFCMFGRFLFNRASSIMYAVYDVFLMTWLYCIGEDQSRCSVALWCINISTPRRAGKGTCTSENVEITNHRKITFASLYARRMQHREMRRSKISLQRNERTFTRFHTEYTFDSMVGELSSRSCRRRRCRALFDRRHLDVRRRRSVMTWMTRGYRAGEVGVTAFHRMPPRQEKIAAR